MCWCCWWPALGTGLAAWLVSERRSLTRRLGPKGTRSPGWRCWPTRVIGHHWRRPPGAPGRWPTRAPLLARRGLAGRGCRRPGAAWQASAATAWCATWFGALGPADAAVACPHPAARPARPWPMFGGGGRVGPARLARRAGAAAVCADVDRRPRRRPSARGRGLAAFRARAGLRVPGLATGSPRAHHELQPCRRSWTWWPRACAPARHAADLPFIGLIGSRDQVGHCSVHSRAWLVAEPSWRR